MMEAYGEIIKVVGEDLDELEHVNNIRYVKWIQDISRKHWEAVVDKELRKSLIWVVRNHNITYHRAAVLGDSIHITTNIESFSGPLSNRSVEMKDRDSGELLVRALTQWCLLDAGSLRPKRVPEAIQKLFGQTG